MSLKCCGSYDIRKAKLRSRVKVGNTYHKISSLAKMATPKAAVNLVDGIKLFKRKIKLTDLVESIEAGDPGKIIRSIPFESLPDDFKGFKSDITQTFGNAVMLTIPSLPAPKDNRMRFDANNPRIDRYINTRTGNLIQDITDETHDLVRTAVTRTFTQGKTPRDVAMEIKDSIGLHDRYAKALANYNANLREQKVNPDRAALLSEKYEDRLLYSRAMTIARTETRMATNNGQLAVWNQAANSGLIRKVTARKVWVTDGDPCPICEPMDGESVPIDGVWMLDDGTICEVPTDSHPNCYCGMELEFDESGDSDEDLSNDEEE